MDRRASCGRCHLSDRLGAVAVPPVGAGVARESGGGGGVGGIVIAVHDGWKRQGQGGETQGSIVIDNIRAITRMNE